MVCTTSKGLSLVSDDQMPDKRRLSSGSRLSIEIETDDLDVSLYGPASEKRNSRGNGRRRSSFGAAMLRSPNGKAAPDQAKLAEMYTAIIKMSSENKINNKNSWDLKLIDHMRHLISEEPTGNGTRGVNFQKASCTLDASVKIYSHRVDDTWTTSYRILENLSRNGAAEYDEGSEVVKGPARVGSKAISSRNGLTSTIEPDKEKLNTHKVESDYCADAMFHKMSQAFDEGGAKGMLLNNLRVSPNSSTLVFTSENLITSDEDGNTSAPALESNSPVDISEILLKSGVVLSDLESMTVAPALDQYRSDIELLSSSAGSFDSSSLNLKEFDRSIEAGRTCSVQSCPHSSAAYEDFDDDDDDVESGGYGYCEEEDHAAGKNISERGSVSTEAPNAPKLDWNAIFSEQGQHQHPTVAMQEVPNDSHDSEQPLVDIAGGNEYTFINFSSLRSNSWAGARHWRFAPKWNRVDIKEKSDVVGTTSTATRSTASKAKEAFYFNFDSEWSSQGAFNVDEENVNAFVLGSAALNKSAEIASSGAYTLPMDAKLGPRDLCRLFSCSNMIVPPSSLTGILGSSKTTGTKFWFLRISNYFIRLYSSIKFCNRA